MGLACAYALLAGSNPLCGTSTSAYRNCVGSETERFVVLWSRHKNILQNVHYDPSSSFASTLSCAARTHHKTLRVGPHLTVPFPVLSSSRLGSNTLSEDRLLVRPYEHTTFTTPPDNISKCVPVCSVCVPLQALASGKKQMQDEPEKVSAASEAQKCNPFHPLVQFIRHDWGKRQSRLCTEIPMILVFTRGLSPAGLTPSSVVVQGCGSASSSPVAVLSVCGPVLPREWIQQNCKAASLIHSKQLSDEEKKVEGFPENLASADKSLSRPYSGTSFTVSFVQFIGTMQGEEANLPRPSDASSSGPRVLPYPHNALEKQLAALFPRENIRYFYHESEKGTKTLRKVSEDEGNALLDARVRICNQDETLDILGLVNGVIPILAFGAGLVQAEYGTSIGSASALLSYTQNAVRATELLVFQLSQENSEVNELESDSTMKDENWAVCSYGSSHSSRWRLPSEVHSAIYASCLEHSSREFQLGKRMNFYFRKEDALRAVYGVPRQPSKVGAGSGRRECGSACSPQDMVEEANNDGVISDTVEGLHSLLHSKNISSPFFQALIDAFLTIRRGSEVGQELVSSRRYEAGQGGYGGVNSDEVTSSPSLLLEKIKKVDQAMIHGTEEDLKLASKELADAFTTKEEMK